MLDPAGDAGHAGRVLQDCYERGATLQFCNELKSSLERTIKNLRVILTRVPGEPPCETLQNANFCNKINADFYLSVHFYKEKEVVPNIWIYFFKNESFFRKPYQNELIFYPYDKIWMYNFSKTEYYSKIMHSELKKRQANKFECRIPKALPFKPLVGIKPPAIALEIGIQTSNQAKDFIEPITECLDTLVRHIQGQP